MVARRISSHEEHDAAQRPDVRLAPAPALLHRLGRHVEGRAAQRRVRVGQSARVEYIRSSLSPTLGERGFRGTALCARVHFLSQKQVEEEGFGARDSHATGCLRKERERERGKKRFVSVCEKRKPTQRWRSRALGSEPLRGPEVLCFFFHSTKAKERDSETLETGAFLRLALSTARRASLESKEMKKM